VLFRGLSTRQLVRRAPRSLQVGLLTPCDLACGFCYRDRTAPSLLQPDFLLDLLERCEAWGVLEVAFGGGEPLLFKGLVQMLRDLRARTRLGIGLTTNGTRLDASALRELAGLVDELRLSAYPDNGYRATLQRARGAKVGPVGLNLLVTPVNVGLLEPLVLDALALGASDVLLLGYKGPDPTLHLGDAGIAALQAAVRRLEGAPLKLDVCWYPLLPHVPHLFERSDCGAGDRFLVITPDRAAQPCSFHDRRVPFDTFDELVSIWEGFRAERPATSTAGCTRPRFLPLATPQPEALAAWTWRARASNNSGDWTIVARFCDPARAQRVATALRELARAHEAFLASPEGQAFVEQNGYDGSVPTPPLVQFGEAHGFAWTEGLWWEEDGAGAPVLTAGAIGDAVVVYHPYCMGLPELPFQEFFTRMGAEELSNQQYRRPHVVVTAHGASAADVQAIRAYLERLETVDYASELREPPPWGGECQDPRVASDEDRSARLDNGPHQVDFVADHLRLTVSLCNVLAGSLQLERWLRERGASEVSIVVQRPDDAAPLESADPKREPILGLFGELGRPLQERLAGASPDARLSLLFATGRIPTGATLADLPPNQVAELALPLAERAWAAGLDVSSAVDAVVERAGSAAAPLAVAQWRAVDARGNEERRRALRALAVLPDNEVEALTRGWLEAPSVSDVVRGQRLQQLDPQGWPWVLPILEAWWIRQPATAPIQEVWGRVARACRLDWPTAARWLGAGRPLSLVALDGLRLLSGAWPTGMPPESTLNETLDQLVRTDPTPRTEMGAAYLRKCAKDARRRDQ
jgi:hypothetical protein